MGLDQTQIQFIEYEVYYKGVNIGYTKMDVTSTNLGITYRRVDDTGQFTGLVALAKSGAAPKVNVEIYQAKFANVFNNIAGDQVYPMVQGARVSWGIGARKIDLFQDAGEIILHPTGVDIDDFENDIMYWLATPDLSQATWGGKRDGAQSMVIPFDVLPNTEVSLDLTYGIFGDHTASAGVPDDVFITTEAVSRTPHKHQSAITMTSGRRIQFYCHSAYHDDSTDVGAVNEAGNVTSTEPTFNIDGITDVSTWTVGSYFKIGTEIFQIYDRTAVSATEVTVSCYRGIFGSTQATHADNAVCTLLSNAYVIPTRRRATWASSSTGDFTVGNSNANENKGLAVWVADGSGNLTATDNGTASPNCVVTTTT